MDNFMDAPVGVLAEEEGDADWLHAPHLASSLPLRIACGNRFNDDGLMPENQTARKTSSIIRVGPAGWSYPDWFGYVYPTPKRKGFHEATYLAQFFDTIEINTSFYSPIRPDHAAQWTERVAANPRFVFTAKLLKR